MIYTKETAEAFKKRAGESWRPSNGFEGDLFMERVCRNCANNKDCEIMLASMAFDTDEQGYPEELIYNDDGQPTCTSFKLNADKEG